MYVDNFEYELNVNENGEILLWFKIKGERHSIGLTERDAKAFVHLFKMHNMTK
ncbi:MULTISPECIES: hypothetical protein [Bacillus cereus group]|uniref:hypothetical protein n=1 Tax=Bacillus cereus group TaxID=86661 RepID=UPI0015D4EFFA|nr:MULTISPECIES: hypothetical protein [Bacillus cereus group]HDR4695239.1 hypothetical protein [Bacillus cereus]